MNKKIGSFLFAVSLLISACSDFQQTKPDATDIEASGLGEEYIDKAVGEIIETEEGQRTIIKILDNLNESQTSGPFKITIRDVRLSQFKPKPEKVSDYGGEDLGLISIYLEVENTSDETAFIYPNQGTIQTDTEKKVTTHFSLSQPVGGEYPNQSTKTGKVYSFFVGQVADVSEVIYQIEAAHDEEIQPLGEDFEFVFNFD